MTITTKFDAGRKIYFYTNGYFAEAKIISISVRSTEKDNVVEYILERKDKNYVGARDMHYTQLGYRDDRRSNFREDEIAGSLEDLKESVIEKKRKEIQKEIERIKDL